MSWDVGSWVIDTVNSVLGTLIKTHGSQTFTSDGTFTVPSGVTKIWVTAAAGGQAGQHSSKSSKTGGDGGAGGDCILKKAFSVAPEQVILITIGKGGTSNLQVGGSTVVGNLVTLAGGDNSRISTNGGGRGGTGGLKYSDSDNGINAENGQSGLLGIGGTVVYTYRKHVSGGGGGGSIGDGGLPGGSTSKEHGNGHNGTNGGGGGGATGIDYNYDGGRGGDGIVIIEW